MKTIISDLGNVIVTVNEEYLNKFNTPETLCFLKNLEKGKISEQEFIRKIYKKKVMNLEEFHETFISIFKPNKEMIEFLKTLKGKYKLIILSNTNKIHIDFLKRKFPEIFFFDSYLLSFEIGSRKPEEETFRKVVEQAGCKPEECLYIDDVREFTDAAKKQGMETIHYRSFPQFKQDFQNIIK